MSRITPIDPKLAEGRTRELLDSVQKKMGAIPNLTRVMAVSPAVLDAYLQFSGALSHGVLAPKVREQIALAVGEANGCNYCVSAHTFIGGKLGLSPDELLNNRHGHAADPKTDALLGLAGKIVASRGDVSDADFAQVRAAGGSDAEIAEIIAHVALNAFTNYLNLAAETPIDFPVAPDLKGK